jgi:hypothetical protein
MTTNDHCVSLIAVGPNQVAPARIPVADARLPSLEAVPVRAWIDRWNAQGRAVFAVPGRMRSADDRPVLVVDVGQDEYERLAATVRPHGE